MVRFDGRQICLVLQLTSFQCHTSQLNVYHGLIYNKDIIFFLIFHWQNKDTNQSECRKSKAFVFVKTLKRNVSTVLTIGWLNFFLEFFLKLFLYCVHATGVCGSLIHGRLAVCAASLQWPKQDYLEGLLAMPCVFLWKSQVCQHACLEQRITSVMAIQKNQLITEWMPWKLEELFLLISFRFY